MKVAILEIAPHGHYTYVESIAKIYTSVLDNEVVIFTNEKGGITLQHLETDKIKIIKPEPFQDVSLLIDNINGFDKLFIVTLEAYVKETYRLMLRIKKKNFNCPIYYVIHNVDFWFQQSLCDKFYNLVFRLKSFKELLYRFKVYFYYSHINTVVIEKVLNSNGKFVTLASSVANELAKYVENDKIEIIPFSIFDGEILKLQKERIKQKVRICIPGFVSSIRRDYESIFELLENDKDGFLKEKVELDLLGGISEHEGGVFIKQKAIKLIEEGYCIYLYDKPLVGIQEFDENLAQADLILGNMHLQQGAYAIYGKSKESGLTFTMIKAAKVGLLPSQYNYDEALDSSVVTFQNYNEIPFIIKNILEKPLYWESLKKNALLNSEKFRPISIYRRLEKV